MQININVQLSPELQKQLEQTILLSQETLRSMQDMSESLAFYAKMQTIMLGVLVVVCVLTLVILIVRDHQLRGIVTAAWRRLWRR